MHTADIQITHMALLQAPTATAQLGFQREKYLYSCVQSVKAWFDVFFTMAPNDYVGFPFSIISQLVRCLSILHQLSTLDDPAWNRHDVMAMADVLAILDRVAGNMEQVPFLAEIDNTESPDGDVFTQTAKLFRSLASKWSSELNTDDRTTSVLQPQPASSGEMLLPDSLDFDWFGDGWLLDYSTMPNQ